MEQGNQQTQDQIDQIEGTDSSLGNDGYSTIDSSNSVQPTIQGDSTGTPALYRTQDTVQFSGTYKSLKEAVKYLADQSGRMTLDNVNASFDSSTGNLTGTMTINIFSMTGGSTSYSAPDAGSTVYGNRQHFRNHREHQKKQEKQEKGGRDRSCRYRSTAEPGSGPDTNRRDNRFYPECRSCSSVIS